MISSNIVKNFFNNFDIIKYPLFVGILLLISVENPPCLREPKIYPIARADDENNPIAASLFTLVLSPILSKMYAANITTGITIKRGILVNPTPIAMAYTPKLTWLNPSPIIEYLFNTKTTPKIAAVIDKSIPTNRWGGY